MSRIRVPMDEREGNVSDSRVAEQRAALARTSKLFRESMDERGLKPEDLLKMVKRQR
jgi:hypothetical protein